MQRECSNNMEATICESVEGADVKEANNEELQKVTSANETATCKSSRLAKRVPLQELNGGHDHVGIITGIMFFMQAISCIK